MQLIRKATFVKGGKKWFYDTGVFKTISDVVAVKLGSGGTPWITKYATYFAWQVSNGKGFFRSDITVNLAPIRILHFVCNNANGNTVYIGVQPNASDTTGLRSVSVTSATDAEYTLDVSDLTSNYYLVGGFQDGNTTRYLNVTKMWGE